MPNKKIILIILFLTSATFLAFWQVIHCDFINFDDDFYVTANSRVQDGISLKGIRWAFTTNHAANWHPLTWLSHMLDVQFFGLNPRWHHLTNLLFHIANVLLLFLVLHRMTKALWQSAFVAALFALHPLHVESVAWVAERKDVLSTFFWMLTMGAYLFYVERPGLQRYLTVLVFFALGLMAKPMLVTLPFVLLLMDYWPLRRFEQTKLAQEIRAEVNDTASADKRKRKGKKKLAVKSAGRTVPGAAKTDQMAGPKHQWEWIRPLLWEKIPLFSLAVLSSIVTYIVQQQGGAVKSIEASSLSVRIANAFVSDAFYIVKMIWPSNLAVFYPHPGVWPLWQIMVSGLLFIAATFVVIRRAKRFRYLALGWLWYVGTLVPVIGLVQVGEQARADRYTYIPLIGLFIIVAWGIPELLERRRYRKEICVALSALSLLGFFFVTWTQVGYWQDSITLYNHTLRVTNQNFKILNNRGVGYDSLGNYTQAIADFDKAIQIKPNFAMAYTNRGSTYDSLGNYTQAIADFDKAIQIKPTDAKAYNNRAATYGKLSHYTQAIADFDKAIEIDPEFAMAYTNRGSAYGNLGNYSRAIADFDKAIEINSKNAKAYINRGVAYESLGNYTQAVADFDKAIQIDPKDAMAYNNRGVAYSRLGDFSQAIRSFDRAITINPRNDGAYCNRGIAHGMLGNYRQAIEDFDRTVALNPKFAEAYYYRSIARDKLGNQSQALDDLKTAARFGSKEAKDFLISHNIDWQ